MNEPDNLSSRHEVRTPPIAPGDTVTLSDHGREQFPRYPRDRLGAVVRVSGLVTVMWAGNRSASKLHASFLRVVEAPPEA